eukprot:COSAG04_NODE_15170_length_541_cov_0.907240_2_plen_73_part_01
MLSVRGCGGTRIVWAARTYHAAFPLLPDFVGARHSTNFGRRAQPGVTGADPVVYGAALLLRKLVCVLGLLGGC